MGCSGSRRQSQHVGIPNGAPESLRGNLGDTDRDCRNQQVPPNCLRGGRARTLFVKSARQVTLGTAAFILLCFFLPWMQMSCAGIKDSASGLDLARETSPSLWILPLMMLAILGLGLSPSIWERFPALFAITSIVGGGLSAYLMYRERLRRGESSGLIAASWTAWFWLGFVASLLLPAVALSAYSNRNKE